MGEVVTPSQLSGLGETLFDRIERRRVECGQPADNVRLMQSWNRSALTVTARESRYGEYCSFTILPVDDQTYSPEWVADLELAYRWNRYTFAAGAENLFDTFPDPNLVRNANGAFTAQSNNGIFTYPSNSPFGMNGRFVYTRVAVNF